MTGDDDACITAQCTFLGKLCITFVYYLHTVIFVNYWCGLYALITLKAKISTENTIS